MPQPTPDGAPRRFAPAVAGIVAFAAVLGVGLAAPRTASAAASKTTRVAATKTTRVAATKTTRVAATTTVRPLPTTTTEAAKDIKTDIERKIVAAQKASAPDLAVGRATCPKVLAVPTSKLPTGTFQCTVIIEGTVAPYEVILSSTGGFQKGGTYRIAPAKAIIDTGKIVAFVSSSLDASDRAIATIACGKKRVVVLDPGKTLTCTIIRKPAPLTGATGASTTVDTTPQILTFLVKDKDGRVALQP